MPEAHATITNGDREDILIIKKQALARQKSGDFAQAAACLQQALDRACASGAPLDEVLDLTYALGTTNRFQGALDESLAHFHRCLELAEHHQESAWFVRTLRALGEVYLRQKQLDHAIDAFRRAAETAETTSDTRSTLITQARLARALSDRGERDEALRLADTILQRISEHRELSRTERYTIAGQALLTLAFIRFRMGHYRLARRFLHRTLKFLAFTRVQLPLAEAMRLLGIIDSESKNFAAAIPKLYEAWEIYRELHYDPGRFDTYWSLGITYLDMGDLRNARLCLKQAEAIAQSAGLKPEYGKSQSKLADIETREGNYAKALEFYLEDLQITQTTSDTQALGYCHLNVGQTFRRLGKMDDAERHLGESIQSFESTNRTLLAAKARLELAECLLLKNTPAELDRALEITRECEPVLRRTESAIHAALVDRMIGKILFARGESARAIDHFAISIQEQLKCPPTRLLAETRFEAAWACHANGDRQETLEHLRNAAGLAETLGSRDIRDAALRKLEEIDPVQAQTLKLAPYLPNNAIEEMVSQWVDIDRRKSPLKATIMFVDMRGYTSLSGESEAFDLVEAVEAFLSLIVRIITHHGGVVDKFIGDSVMATFGLPRTDGGAAQTPEQGARMAVWAGIEIIEQLRATTRVREEAGAGGLHASIGINTGEVIAGCFGPLEKRDYTVIGYHVNLAARLQSLASELLIAEEDRMLLNESTYEIAKEIIEAEPLPEEVLQLKGITDGVRAWRVLGRKHNSAEG